MIPLDVHDLLASAVRLWKGTGIGLGEMVDRIEDLAARQELLFEEPDALLPENVEPRLRKGMARRTDLDGDELRELRAFGFTVEEIAEKFACTTSTVARCLSGYSEEPKRLGRSAELTYKTAGDF